MNFKYYLGTYEKKNGTIAVRLKLETSQKDVQYIDSGVSVLKSQWDANRQRIKKHPLEEQFNGRLGQLLNDVQKAYYDNPGVSAKRLLIIYKNKERYSSSSFIEFYRSLVEENRLRGKIRSAVTQEKYLDKLQKFGGNVLFSDLSVQFAKDYELWMLKKGNMVNTVASNLKAIYAALNKAVEIGIIKENPVRGYKIVTENSEKESLTYEEVIKLSDEYIHPRFKGMCRARDMFLFSFYTAGMRFSDVCRLEWKNVVGNEVVYTMNKSRSRAGSKRIIPLAPKAMEILEIYRGGDERIVFPYLYGTDKSTVEEIEHKLYVANNATNRSLKILSEKVLGKKITMHSAKHSFADYAVKNDVGILIISKLLGHTKLSTTQHYLKDFYHKEQSDEMTRLFG